jgi:hypothetical protein
MKKLGCGHVEIVTVVERATNQQINWAHMEIDNKLKGETTKLVKGVELHAEWKA